MTENLFQLDGAVGTLIVPADDRYFQVRPEQTPLNCLSGTKKNRKTRQSGCMIRETKVSAIAKHGQIKMAPARHPSLILLHIAFFRAPLCFAGLVFTLTPCEILAAIALSIELHAPDCTARWLAFADDASLYSGDARLKLQAIGTVKCHRH